MNLHNSSVNEHYHVLPRSFLTSLESFDRTSPSNSKIQAYKNTQAKLLIVDDDDIDRERINRFIQKFKLPLTTIEACNGKDALKKISEHNIDLILLDYQLGDMTGTDLLGELKNTEYKNIPTIMITGMGDETTAVEAMRFGVFDYLPKQSITAESLVGALESVLHSAHLQKELTESQQRLERLSMYDELTGLANRNLHYDRMTQAINLSSRNKTSFTVLMIDLNLFKEINDTMGHQAGDCVLTTVGNRLLSTARKSDTVARLGGDEFSCLLHDVSDLQCAAEIAEKIQDSISKQIVIDDKIVQIGASIGIARYPEHGADINTLMSNADHAMYIAKKSNKNFHVYNDDQSSSTSSNISIIQNLHSAIPNKELFLEYQPKINIKTGETIGIEALVRWNSPSAGLIPPGKFIGLAERSSLIELLTNEIIDLVIEDIKKFNITHPIAINIAARSLDDPNFYKNIYKKIGDANLFTPNILLEITETTLSSSSQNTQDNIEQLQMHGFQISIDDFGSGFTSFSAVRDFSFNEIKIDQTFIENITHSAKDAAIVSSLLSLGENLGIRIIAEGVETQEQLTKLSELGCNYIQGYLIAKPMTASKLQSWQNSTNKK